jgi:hypothetical protein
VALPFEPGEHNCIADDRDVESLRMLTWNIGLRALLNLKTACCAWW